MLQMTDEFVAELAQAAPEARVAMVLLALYSADVLEADEYASAVLRATEGCDDVVDGDDVATVDESTVLS